MTSTSPSRLPEQDRDPAPCFPIALSSDRETKASRRVSIVLLGLILVLAATIRLVKLDSVLPGFQVDDASNAWNAWCLLHTGRDEWGKPWPWFYTRAFDDNRSPLYLYLLIPVQAIGGLSLYTTRLPGAICGIVTVGLLYFIGKRMFDTPTGSLAALFLALDPAHIEYTQRGHEAAIAPLLFAAPLAALLWAGAPFSDIRIATSRWPRALLAGLLTGLGCYGYAALRMIIPVSFGLAALVVGRQWREYNRSWLIALFGGFFIFFGPLVYMHLTDPNISSRARSSMVWMPDDPLTMRAEKVFDRYVEHFGYTFLFSKGGQDDSYALPPGYGFLNGYLLPALMLGLLAAAVGAWRGSVSCRVLLVLLAAYPAGDILFRADGPNSFRCFPGVIPLVLLSSLGIIQTLRWIAAKMRIIAIAGVVAYVPFVVAGAIGFLVTLFGSFSENPQMLLARQYDLMLACQRFGPQIKQADRVLVTSYGTIYPYIHMLVNLRYDPKTWQSIPRQYKIGPPPFTNVHVCTSFDKFRFLYYPQDALSELRADQQAGRHDRVVMLLRPHQIELAGNHQPIGQIELGGQIWLLVYAFDL